MLENIPTHQIIMGSIVLLAMFSMIFFGKKLSKAEDDPDVQKLGKGFYKMGLFMLFVIVIVAIFKSVQYFFS